MRKYLLLFMLMITFGLCIPTSAIISTSPNTLLPLREVGQSLGYTLKWDNTTKEALIFDSENNYAILSPDNPVVNVSGDRLAYLSTPPILINNTLFVPVSFWEDAFDLDVIIRDGNLVIQKR